MTRYRNFFSTLTILIILTANVMSQNSNNNDFKIVKVTIAITKVNEMVKFYKNVFNINFKESPVYGTTLYSGKFGDLNILLCPNEIAGVKAEQNRQQFDIVVPDIEKIIQAAKNAGGSIKGKINVTEKQKTVTIVDPDGNTIVFIQNL